MKTKKKKGFTLTELIVVIVIIGVLAAVLIPSLTGYITKAQNAKDETHVISLNKELNLRKIADDDINFYTAYDVQAYLESVGMANIEVANKNNLILYDTVEEKFVLIKEDEINDALIKNEFVYHISEYYSINHHYYDEPEENTNQSVTATVMKLGYTKLSTEDECGCGGKHRAFIISINGPEIAKAVKAVMDLPYTSDTKDIKQTLNSMKDSNITISAYDTIVKTLYVDNNSYYYYDNDLKKYDYNNNSYLASENKQENDKQQKITRVVILPEVEEVNLNEINNLQKSTILLPNTCETVTGEVKENLKIDFIGNVSLLDGDYQSTDYNEAYKKLDIKEITFINCFVKTETELYDLLDTYEHFDEINNKIIEAYGEEEALSEEDKKIIILKDITINKNVTIPVGVSLLIPYDDNYKSNGDGGNNGFVKIHSQTDGVYDFASYRKNYFIELTIASGKQVTVEGTIIVGGVTGTTVNGILAGHTSGNYGQLTLLGDSEIILSSTGTLDVYGYVIGEGTIKTSYNESTQKGSVINEPFVIGDYFGGKQSAMLAGKLGYTINSNGQCAPFSQYGLTNIQVKMNIVKGASLNGHVKIYMDGDYQTNNGVALPLISSENASFIKINKGYVELSYQEDKVLDYKTSSFSNIGQTKIDIYGDIETGKIDINVSAAGMSFSLSSSDFLLPIPFNFSVNFIEGSSIIKTDLALFPGSEMVVSSKAELQISSNASLFIVDKLAENSGNNTAFSHQTLYYPCKEQSNFIVNGKLVIKGTFGGVIQTKQKDAQVITTTKAVLDGSNQAKFGCKTKEFLVSSISFSDDSTLNNYALKGYIVNNKSLVEMTPGQEYTSIYDEIDCLYTGTANDKIECFVADKSKDVVDYKQKFSFFDFKAGTQWQEKTIEVDRLGMNYYGKWSVKDADFYTVEIISVDEKGNKLELNQKLENEYALKTNKDTIYITTGIINYTTAGLYRKILYLL